MAKKIIKAQMKQRRDTFANWAAENPVLLDGELGIVSDDPNLYKVGDGSTAWNALPFRGFDGTLAQELGTSPNAVISQKVVSEKLSELSERINNLPQGEEFDKQGNYPLLHVGTADDLAGRGESVPASFGFRASGGKSIKDGRAYIKRIKGNSVVWNQKYKPASSAIGTQTINGVTFTISKDGTVEVEGTAEGGSAFVALFAYRTFIASHKYLLIAYGAPAGEWNKQGLYFVGITGLNEASMIKSAAGYKIFQPSADGESRLTITTGEGYSLSCRFRPIFIDLTQMFGAGNEPTTIEDFNARVATLGVDLNAYNEGQVIHMNTESIKSVGDNAWDEEWESGIINYSTGNDTNSANHCRTVGYTQVIPNEQYYISFPTASYSSDLVVICYDENKAFIQHIGGGSANKTFRIPTNCHYIRFTWYGTQYANNIMLTLVHSGWKQDTDAGYQPYWQDTLPLPIISKYFPDGMKSAGSAHDEIRFNKASGKWEYSKGKIKSVDLGTLNWNYTSGNISKFSCMMPSDARVFQDNVLPNIMTSLYTAQKNDANILGDKNIYRAGSYLGVLDSSYTDAATFKAAMSGVMLYYEAAEWEWVELDAEDQNFRDYYNVADFGTEMSQSSVPSAAFSADIIYQFNAVDMIREHEIEINELQSIIATMQAQLASLINKE